MLTRPKRWFRGEWTRTRYGRAFICLYRWLEYKWAMRTGCVVDCAKFNWRVRRTMVREGIKWDHILRLDLCAYCNARVPFAEMTVEHVLARSRGGRDISSNKVGCCERCNHARGAMPLLLYMLKRQDQLPRKLFRLRNPRPRLHWATPPHPPLRATIADLIEHRHRG